MLQNRNSLTEIQWKNFGIMIEEKLLSLTQYKEAEVLLVYGSYQKEVPTYGIMENAFVSGKRVFCPKVLSPGKMEFYEIQSVEDLIRGFKNIPEPKSTEIVFGGSEGKKTLLIMPVVGFDCYNNRLGYGGGFYDRYLQRYPDLQRVGLAFECQRFEKEIPIEDTDLSPDFLITEKGIWDQVTL